MKKIYFIRHAKAVKNVTNSDFKRELSKVGKEEAKIIGKRLAIRGANPDKIYTSSAIRAFKTAKIIAKKVGFKKNKIVAKRDLYGANVEILFSFLRGIKNKFNDVFLIAHNNEITQVCEFLSDSGIENIPTCGVFCIEFDVQKWGEIAPHSGKAVFFDYPAREQNEL